MDDSYYQDEDLDTDSIDFLSKDPEEALEEELDEFVLPEDEVSSSDI